MFQAYTNNAKICRSQQLLAYFGETNSTPCGICDVCIGQDHSNKRGHKTKQQILMLLSSGPYTSRKIQQLLGSESDMVLIALQELLEERSIKLDDKNQYYLL